ncbi:MAG: ABC transporter substrate-binding protein [Alphaproteobacteria bacterium]|nr:ABC transporter substrate-binding protein [Alphaproteobacteria bacterium]
MTTGFTKIFSALALVSLLIGCKDDKKTEAGKNATLTVAVSADYPPFEYYKDGKIVGFEIDLMNAIGKELKRDVTFQDLPFESILGALQSKRVDLSISCLSATPERAKVVDFSVHYNTSKTVLITDDVSIKSMNDLKGKTVGVQLGSTNEICLKEWLPKVAGMKMQSLSKVPDLIQNLKVKRIVGIVLGETEAYAVMNEVKGLQMIDIPNTEFSSAIAFPKGSALVASVNQAIQKMQTDGSLKALQDKWLRGKVNA